MKRRICSCGEELTALELAFESKALLTLCESESRACSELGADVAESLKHRLADLRAARTATDLLVGRPRTIAGNAGECMPLIYVMASGSFSPLTIRPTL
jgi:hypothetical protein